MRDNRDWVDARRTRLWRLALSVTASCAVALFASTASAQLFQVPTAIQNARILTMDGRVLPRATLLIKGEKIVAIGSGVKVPLLALRVDAKGGTMTPGFVDVSSVLGRTDTSLGSAGLLRRAEDGFDHYDTVNLSEALRNGVTTVCVRPMGPAGFQGTASVLRLARDPKVPDKLGRTLKAEAAVCIDWGRDAKPIARLKTLASVRKEFREAIEYRRMAEDYAEDLAKYVKTLEKAQSTSKQKKTTASKPSDKQSAEESKKNAAVKKEKTEPPKKPQRPKRNPSAELLLKAIDRKLPVRITARTSDDILNALELAREFGFDLILDDAMEAYRVADQIAESRVPVILTRMDAVLSRDMSATFLVAVQRGAALSRSGVTWAVGSGLHDGASTRFLAFNAQLASAADSRKDALRLITVEAAELLGVSDRIGRLRTGLLADFVLWSGDPRDPASRVLRVYVGGIQVYDVTAPSKQGASS